MYKNCYQNDQLADVEAPEPCLLSYLVKCGVFGGPSTIDSNCRQ